MATRSRSRSKSRKDRKPKICRFCENRVTYIDFLDADTIKKFQTENGRILPRRVTGSCMNHQKMLARAIKRARELALVM